MNTKRGIEAANQGLAAAARRFPGEGRQIEQLMERSESFRGLCADLDAAEHALATVDTLPIPLRAERRAEFEALAGDLANEIGEWLRAGNVVSINDLKQRHPPAAPGEEQ
jgi:hypothetical protein